MTKGYPELDRFAEGTSEPRDTFCFFVNAQISYKVVAATEFKPSDG